MFYFYSDRIDTKKYFGKYQFAWLILFAISLICTIKGNSLYIHASRALAGSAGTNTIVYYRLGIGGYGFVYASAFIASLLVVCYRLRSNPISRIAYIIVFVITLYMLAIADYMTAVLLVVGLAVFSIIETSKLKKPIAYALLLLGVSIVIVFRMDILLFVKKMFDSIGSYMIVYKIDNIINTIKTDSIFGLERMQLYRNGLLNFYDRIIWGLPQDSSLLRTSNHSEIIAYLERFGIWGLYYIYALLSMCNTVRKRLKNNMLKKYYSVVMIAFIIFAVVNRIDAAPEIGMIVFFVVPITLIQLDNIDSFVI